MLIILWHYQSIIICINGAQSGFLSCALKCANLQSAGASVKMLYVPAGAGGLLARDKTNPHYDAAAPPKWLFRATWQASASNAVKWISL
jgi:hypothetical protein